MDGYPVYTVDCSDCSASEFKSPFFQPSTFDVRTLNFINISFIFLASSHRIFYLSLEERLRFSIFPKIVGNCICECKIIINL